MTAKADIPLSERAAHLRIAIVRTARRLRQEAAAETSGLTPTSVAALAAIERVKRPTITRTLVCLEREGLIDRARDPEDGRSALISVNGAGRERLRRLRGRKNAYLARRMRDLTDEEVETLERATEILERMREGDRG